MNTFGNLYRLTTFGESHGAAMGGVIDGLPARIPLSISRIQQALDKRRPGGSAEVSQRREPDRVELLSGVMQFDEENPDLVVTLGTPIGFVIRNRDAQSGAYDALRHVYRPNHADATYDAKYGIRDWRGGGRASGRETVSRVVAGAIAMQVLEPIGVKIQSTVTEIGGCTHPEKFAQLLADARAEGDSLGGIVETVVTGVAPGLGEPTFCKLQQMLASAMMSIGAAHGFEYGDGFRLARKRGSDDYDNGGILGGISTGDPIRFRVAFKPTPSISKPLSGKTDEGEPITVVTNGRHDPCIALRGCEVVRAMTAIVLLDAWLADRARKNFHEQIP